MDDADLEKLTIKPGVLKPKFDRNTTEYAVTLASNVEKITLDYFTSDSNASTQILNHDGGRSVTLKEGDTTPVNIEVTAEDGAVKVYQINARRLSARDASLSGIEVISGELEPAFKGDQFLYTCNVPYHLCAIKVTPSVLDKKIAVTVNGQDPSSAEISLNVGETSVDLEVISADGSNKAVYTIVVLKKWLGHAVQFVDKDHQAQYECPISLAPCYRPVGIVGSCPRHVFSGPIINELTRTSKQDPLDGTLLEGDWREAQKDREKQMSQTIVECLFAYKGCSEKLKYHDLGDHIHRCTYRPKLMEEQEGLLTCKECSCKIAKDEGDWHTANICSSKHTGRDIAHMVKEHGWQKKLQETGMGDSVDDLMEQANNLCKEYRSSLPKKGQTKKYEMGSSPADLLHSASVNIACAIKQKPRDPALHYQLGLVMEEQYYAKDVFGITKEDDDIDEGVADLALDPSAKESSKEDDIQAICQQRGAGSKPSLSRQLQAIDEEYRYLIDSGQSGKADYVQTLYVWKSKQATQDGKTSQAASDEETPLGKACLKYLDALSLQQNNVTYNLHAGRVFLLQGKIKEAIERLQVVLSLKPTLPIARLYLGLALSTETDGPGPRMKEAIQYLHDGVEHVLGLSILRAEEKHTGPATDLNSENLLRPTNTQLLRAFIHLGSLLLKAPQEKLIPPKLIFHSASVLAAQSICDLVHCGDTYQSMEWILLDAHTNLLQIMMKEKASVQWIAKRCQYISAIISTSSIPQSQDILQLQEKTCQKGVIAQPTNSYALYLLGNAQLVMYESASGSKESTSKALEDARLSFRASIAQEGKPSIGGQIPEQLTKQGWWQEYLKAKEAENKAPAASKGTTGTAPKKGAVTARGGPTSRGARGVTRGTAAAKSPATRGAATRGGPAARGGPATKPGRGKPPASTSSSTRCASRGGSKSKVTVPSAKQETPATGESKKATTEDSSQQTTPVPANAPLNRVTYQPRLGLARALTKETEDLTEAKMLYNDVIVMAPQVHDAYIELADLLVKTEPLSAVEVYARYPFSEESCSFDDAYLHGEIVRILMKQEQYDDPRLEEHMIAWGRVMGLGCLEKYVAILDGKFKSALLRNIYAGVNRKSVDDPGMQAFFKLKMWL